MLNIIFHPSPSNWFLKILNIFPLFHFEDDLLIFLDTLIIPLTKRYPVLQTFRNIKILRFTFVNFSEISCEMSSHSMIWYGMVYGIFLPLVNSRWNQSFAITFGPLEILVTLILSEPIPPFSVGTFVGYR